MNWEKVWWFGFGIMVGGTIFLMILSGIMAWGSL